MSRLARLAKKEWYNTPVNLKGEIGAGEKDIGLKTSDLGLTSAAGLRMAGEAGAQVSSVGLLAVGGNRLKS